MRVCACMRVLVYVLNACARVLCACVRVCCELDVRDLDVVVREGRTWMWLCERIARGEPEKHTSTRRQGSCCSRSSINAAIASEATGGERQRNRGSGGETEGNRASGGERNENRGLGKAVTEQQTVQHNKQDNMIRACLSELYYTVQPRKGFHYIRVHYTKGFEAPVFKHTKDPDQSP